MTSEICTLSISASLTLALLIAELVLGHFSHCLTLQALTNQTFYNILSMTCAIVAKKLSKKSPGLKSTFGWARLEVLGSLSSLVFLGSLSFASAIECLQTLFHSHHLDAMHMSLAVCIVALVHFAVWLLIFLLVGGEFKLGI
jgi:Co/Zn/Cd efflux system component